MLTQPRTWPARYRLHKYWSRKPPDLVAERIAAATGPGDLVLDPFVGSGTTALVALQAGRRVVGIELNAGYVDIAEKRLNGKVKRGASSGSAGAVAPIGVSPTSRGGAGNVAVGRARGKPRAG